VPVAFSSSWRLLNCFMILSMRWIWWETWVDAIKSDLLALEKATWMFHQSTKSWQRPVKVTIPLVCMHWSEFQSLWDPYTWLPSIHMSCGWCLRQPFHTCLSCSSWTWHWC
jgi:hypothetical protein